MNFVLSSKLERKCSEIQSGSILLFQGEAVWSLCLLTLKRTKSEHFTLRPKPPHLKTGCLACTQGWREANNSREHWACSDLREHVRGAWSVCSSGPAGYWDSIKRAFHLDKHTRCIRSKIPLTRSKTTQNIHSNFQNSVPTNSYLFTGRTLSFTARTNYIDQKWLFAHTQTITLCYKHSQNIIKKCALIMWFILKHLLHLLYWYVKIIKQCDGSNDLITFTYLCANYEHWNAQVVCEDVVSQGQQHTLIFSRSGWPSSLGRARCGFLWLYIFLEGLNHCKESNTQAGSNL